MLAVAICVTVVVLVLSVLACFAWVWYFSDNEERSILTTIFTIITLSFTVGLLAVIPSDIYTAAHTAPDNKLSGDASTTTFAVVFNRPPAPA